MWTPTLLRSLGWLPGSLPLACVFLATNVHVWRRVFGVAGAYYDQQRRIELLSLLVLALLSLWHRRSLAASWGRLPRGARAGLTSFFVLGTVSAVFAARPRAGLREVALYALLVLAALAVAELRKTAGARFDEVALLVVFATASLYVLSFFAFDALALIGLAGTRRFQMWGFDNPRFFGQVGFWLFPLLVASATQRSRRERVLMLAVAVGWGVIVVESGSRSALYGTLLGLAVVLVAFGRGSIRWLRDASAVAVASVMGWFAIYGSLGSGSLARVASKGLDDSGRFPLWSDALALVSTHPLLGIGPEHWAHTRGTELGHPHNIPLQLAAEWGVPAAGIAVGLGLWGLRTWLRRTRVSQVTERSGTVEFALAASIVAAGFASLVEGTTNSPVSQMILATTVGWMLGIHGESDPTRIPSRPGVALATIVPCVAAGLLLFGVIPEALNLSEMRSSFREDHPGEPYVPRFWLIGRSVP